MPFITTYTIAISVITYEYIFTLTDRYYRLHRIDEILYGNVNPFPEVLSLSNGSYVIPIAKRGGIHMCMIHTYSYMTIVLHILQLKDPTVRRV